MKYGYLGHFDFSRKSLKNYKPSTFLRIFLVFTFKKIYIANGLLLRI